MLTSIILIIIAIIKSRLRLALIVKIIVKAGNSKSI